MANDTTVKIVLAAVVGIAGIFADRSQYAKAVEAAKQYCRGNADKWKSLAKKVRAAKREGNPDCKEKDMARFNSALSYFRKQVGIAPVESGGGAPVVKATQAAIDAQRKIDAEESDADLASRTIAPFSGGHAMLQRWLIAQVSKLAVEAKFADDIPGFVRELQVAVKKLVELNGK